MQAADKGAPTRTKNGPSRRAFIRGAAGVAAASTAAGVLGVSGASARDSRAKKTAQTDLAHPCGVAVATDGRILVADAGNYRIRVYAGDLRPLSVFGAPGFGPGRLNFPTGVAAGADGTVWVADRNNGRVCRFDSTGEFLGAVGGLGGAPGSFFSPQSVNLLPDGRLLVVNTRGHNLQVFDATRFECVDVWGYLGDDDGPIAKGDRLYSFRLPTDCVVFDDGRVWVLDSKHGRVVMLQPDGGFDGAFGVSGTGNGQLNLPQAMALGAEALYVCNSGNGCVSKYGLDGTFIRSHDGMFSEPTGIAVKDDRLIVADAGKNALVALEAF